MSRPPRVTRDEFRVEGRYAHGWEEVYAAHTRAEGLERLREYRASERVEFRLRRVRVRIAPAPPARPASTEERWIYSEL